MKILPPPGSGKTHPVALFLGLVVFVFLPFLLIRQVVWVSVQADEERLLEEYRRSMKSEMESFIQEAVPEYQVRKALNRVLHGLPVPGDRSCPELNAAWARRFQKRLKRAFPFPPTDLWIFGPDLKPMVMEGTPPEHFKKSQFIFAYFSETGRYVASHPEFADRLRASYPGEEYHPERIFRFLQTDAKPEEPQPSRDNVISAMISSLWSPLDRSFFLRNDIRRGLHAGDPNTLNEIIPIVAKNAMRYLGMIYWNDQQGRPIGGLLITFDERQISSPWLLTETARSTQHPDLVRSWSWFKKTRRERQWISNKSGLHWIDIPAQIPEMQIRVSLPIAKATHPFQAHLKKIDVILWISILVMTFLGFLFVRNGFQIPLRIYGQLNAALLVVAVVPFIGFASVAFSYVSMKTSLERKVCLRQAENGLLELEGHHRALLGKVLKRFRSARQRIRTLLNDREKIAPFLENLKTKRILSDYFVKLQGDFECVSRNPSDKDNVTGALMSGVVVPLFEGVVPSSENAPPSKVERPKNLKRSLTAEALLSFMLTPQHLHSLITRRNQLHRLLFGISNPAYIFLDFVSLPHEQSPQGVVFFTVTAHSTMDEFLLKHLFRGGSSPHRNLGLDRLIVRGFATAGYVSIPRNTPLSPLEQKLFEQVLGSRERLSRDDFDGPDGGFSAAAPIKDANYIMIGRVDGRTIRAQIQTLRIGVWIVLGYGVLIMFGIGSFLSGKFAFPLLTLREATEAVERNELDIRLEIPSRDEFGELATGFNSMTAGLRERSRMSRFVSASLLETVKREDQGVQEAVCRTDVTVLFSDLRGFTSLSEKHDAATIVDLLNDYFTAMEGPILGNGGDIDKYVGDAIMAVFRAHPAEPPLHHAIRACRAALQMREVLAEFNAERQVRGLFPVNNGIGINTGEVISGHVGSRHGRLDHTVIGDTVNLAARLESESKRGTTTNIIISPSTREVLGTDGIVVSLDRVMVKGKDQPVEIFELLNLRSLDRTPSPNG